MGIMNQGVFFSLDKKTHRFALFLWMMLTMLVFLLLFGPPEFWMILYKLGLDEKLRPIQTWLALFFTAGYQG